MITSESYLLLILIIITAVCLFLCILNVLFLFELRKRFQGLEKKPQVPAVMTAEAVSGQISEQPHDLGSGIRLTAGKYHLESLVIGTADGLVVLSEGTTTPDPGVKLFAFDFRKTPLIVIARARTTPPEEMVPKLEADIRTVLETQL
jgi:hypothetical protein